MIKFFTSVDMRSRKAMTQFLKNHFRYYTMNSWNRSQSYACNLKIYNLGLEKEITDKLYGMIQTEEFFYSLNDLMDEFNAEHNYRWQVGMNGRSGGYLVLYQGELKPSEYRSYCTSCGQRNYRSIQETGNICGKCGKPARVDYIKPPMQTAVFPGRGTDDGEDYEDWGMEKLKERVRLVQDLDCLADAMVLQAVNLAKNYDVEDEEYYIPQTRKVLVAV